MIECGQALSQPGNASLKIDFPVRCQSRLESQITILAHLNDLDGGSFALGKLRLIDSIIRTA